MILVVDDEHAIRTTARAVMEGLGFIVLTAVDGADALIQAAEHREQLAVVITDLHMPEMDGLAFVRVLRRMMPDVPVVVASGQLADDVAVAFASLGVTHRLDKPFTQADLARTLSAML